MITRKALPETNVSQGNGSGGRAAVPRCDDSGAGVEPDSRQDAGAHGVRLRAERHRHAALESGLRGQARRAAADSEAARAVQGGHSAARQPDAQQRAGAARRRRRSRPVLRLLPDRRSAAQDDGRHQGGHLLRPDRRQPDRRARRASPRSKSDSKTRGRRAIATRATPARTRTIWPGGARPSRCRRFSTRARCSSGCSAAAPR